MPMLIFAGRSGLALILGALCLGGQTAPAQTQAAPLPYWTLGGPFGGCLPADQSATAYGNFSNFNGGGASYTRYDFSNGWFGVAESGSMGSTLGINQYGAFNNFSSLQYQGAQLGYNFQNAAGLPLKVYAGFDTLNLKDMGGVAGPLTSFDTVPGTPSATSVRAGIQFQPASNLSLSLGLGYTQLGR